VCADAWTRAALRLIAILESKRQGGKGNGEGQDEGSLVCAAEAEAQIVVLEQGDLEAAQQAVHTRTQRHTQRHTLTRTQTHKYTHTHTHTHTHKYTQVAPSVTPETLEEYARIRAKFSNSDNS
jgi:hypothetical protein